MAIEDTEGRLHRLLLLFDNRLWRLTVVPGDRPQGQETEVKAEYLTLSPTTCRLSVELRWGSRVDGVVQQGFWLRIYRLTVVGDGAPAIDLSVAGRETVQGGWSGDPRLDREELFGRALAAALGWTTAAEDPAQAGL